MPSYDPNLVANTGLFVPSTAVWDVQNILSTDVNSPEFKELLVRLYQNINVITLALNLKDSALYYLQEFNNGQTFFNPTSTDPNFQRSVFRMVVNFGALPNTGTRSVAHNIAFTDDYQLTRMYAAATDPTDLLYIPIPYASPTSTNNIELNADDTNVNITTGSNRSNFTLCIVVLEYTKQ